MSRADRDDEAFTAYAGLIFGGVALLFLGIVLGTAWLAFDRWGGGLRSASPLGGKWTLRAGVDP